MVVSKLKESAFALWQWCYCAVRVAPGPAGGMHTMVVSKVKEVAFVLLTAKALWPRSHDARCWLLQLRALLVDGAGEGGNCRTAS